MPANEPIITLPEYYERLFWEQVFLKAVRRGNDTVGAAEIADNAVKQRRARVA